MKLVCEALIALLFVGCLPKAQNSAGQNSKNETSSDKTHGNCSSGSAWSASMSETSDYQLNVEYSSPQVPAFFKNTCAQLQLTSDPKTKDTILQITIPADDTSPTDGTFLFSWRGVPEENKTYMFSASDKTPEAGALSIRVRDKNNPLNVWQISSSTFSNSPEAQFSFENFPKHSGDALSLRFSVQSAKIQSINGDVSATTSQLNGFVKKPAITGR